MRALARLFVPGRIELLGKHTDYAGGSSLLVAVERGFTLEAHPLAGDEVVVRAAATDEEARWRVERRRGRRGEPTAAVRRLPTTSAAPDWARYAEAVLGRLAAECGEALTGARIVFTSTLPIAAGLSSSSALLTGVFLALDAVCRFSELPAFQAAFPERPAMRVVESAGPSLLDRLFGFQVGRREIAPAQRNLRGLHEERRQRKRRRLNRPRLRRLRADHRQVANGPRRKERRLVSGWHHDETVRLAEVAKTDGLVIEGVKLDHGIDQHLGPDWIDHHDDPAFCGGILAINPLSGRGFVLCFSFPFIPLDQTLFDILTIATRPGLTCTLDLRFFDYVVENVLRPLQQTIAIR